jgi:hypothetical protein
MFNKGRAAHPSKGKGLRRMPNADSLTPLGNVHVFQGVVQHDVLNRLMREGIYWPDDLAKSLRELHRRAVKEGKSAHAAAELVRGLRVALFGENDSRLPAVRSQVHRARVREYRRHHALYKRS